MMLRRPCASCCLLPDAARCLGSLVSANGEHHPTTERPDLGGLASYRRLQVSVAGRLFTA